MNNNGNLTVETNNNKASITSSAAATATTATGTPNSPAQGSFAKLPVGYFTLKEYQTLATIIDSLISNDLKEFEESEESLSKQQQNQQFLNAEKLKQLNELKEYYKRRGSDLDIAYHFLNAMIMTKTRTQISDLKTLLSLLSSAGLGVILTGSLSNFCTLPLKSRQKILNSMKSSSNFLRRQAFKAIVPLTYSLFFTVIHPSSDVNPNWEAIEYDKPPPLEQIPGAEKLNFISVNSDRSFNVDVVVVGSGAGGGVTAALLAKAGYRVLVLEKGGYLSPNNMTWKEFEAFPQLYEQGGTLTSADLSVNILAGSTLGGGTYINWCASIRTPEHVLNEWRKECPNTFNAQSFSEATDKVLQRLNVNTDYTPHNPPNQVLAKGCTDIDIENSVIPRNVKDCDTSQCGSCSMGCRSSTKQSSTVTYLEDACKNGAQIVTNCHVEEITRKIVNGVEQVHGVIGTVTSADGLRYRIFVKANIVVAAAGAIHTPALLLRSRIRNPNIGNTLHLHPAVPVIGEFENTMKVWKGVPMSIIATPFMKTLKNTHGSIIEVPNAHIGLISSIASSLWESSYQFKSEILNASRFSSNIVILRDLDCGKVRLDKDQRTPKVMYTLSDQDWNNLLPGIIGSIKAQVAAGAKKIAVPIAGLEKVDAKEIDELIKSLKSMKYKPNQMTVTSAHQMGSCRMGSSRANSVVNEKGESWEVKKLFIADGSVLPSAVGVNPMITIYATSYSIAQSIISLYPPGNSSNNLNFENSNANGSGAGTTQTGN